MDAKAFVAGLLPLQRIPMLDASLNPSKEDVLAAEVSLPLGCGVDVSTLRLVQMRPPHSFETRSVVLDVSRLPAP